MASLLAEIRARLGSRDAPPRPLLGAIEAGMRLVRNLPLGERLEPAASVIHHCIDLPGARELLSRDDALGVVYQATSEPALSAAFREAAREKRRFTSEEIPAVTQLFTPRWVVEFLLQNTLGRLWLAMHPESRLRREWTLLMSDVPIMAAPPRAARSLRVLDPACGTMNFGLVAIDMLANMYREEMDRAGAPGWPKAASISDHAAAPAFATEHNLFGMDIDPLALELARSTLAIKLGRDVDGTPMNIHRGDGLFDAAPSSAAGFDVVVTNPPYMSSRRIAQERVKDLKREFPLAWRDECTCFLDKSLRMVRPGGRVGMLLMQSFMFTGAFQRFRGDLLDRADIESIAHFGPGLFASGNPGTLQTVGITLCRQEAAGHETTQSGIAIRLTGDVDKEGALRAALAAGDEGRRFRIDNPSLKNLPRGAWSYWVTPSTRRLFAAHRRLGDVSPPRQGLATTDNARFVRAWWEVEWRGRSCSPQRWFPYAKSGRFRRWHESPRHRVDWESDGQRIKESIVRRYPYLKGRWEWVAKNSAYYGRAGVTYSYLTGGRFSARILPSGSLFDVAGSAIFPEDSLTLLAILNSQVCRELLDAINPTINHQAGDLSALPMPSRSSEELRSLVSRAIAVQKQLDTWDETCPQFTAPPAWPQARELYSAASAELQSLETRIEAAVRDIYGLEADHAATSAMTRSPPKDSDLAKFRISFAIGQLVGRWEISDPVRADAGTLVFPDDVPRLREALIAQVGGASAQDIERNVDGLEKWLLGDFAVWHSRWYRSKPPYWIFGGPRKIGMLFFADASRERLTELFSRIGTGGSIPALGPPDDGIALNLCRLAEHLRDANLRRQLKITAGELAAGRYPFAAGF